MPAIFWLAQKNENWGQVVQVKGGRGKGGRFQADVAREVKDNCFEKGGMESNKSVFYKTNNKISFILFLP